MNQQKEIKLAELTIDSIWENRQQNEGEKKALEEMEGFINEILGNSRLGEERYDVVFACYTRLLRHYPEHKAAKAFRVSYAE